MTPVDDGRLEGRVRVLAGAVGKVGEEIARQFAREGGIDVGIDRSEHAVGALSLVAELRTEVQVREAYERVHRELGRVDVVDDKAGPIDPEDRSALEIGVETWDRVLANSRR